MASARMAARRGAERRSDAISIAVFSYRGTLDLGMTCTLDITDRRLRTNGDRPGNPARPYTIAAWLL